MNFFNALSVAIGRELETRPLRWGVDLTIPPYLLKTACYYCQQPGADTPTAFGLVHNKCRKDYGV